LLLTLLHTTNLNIPPARVFHWLPFKHRINFKIATLTYKILATGQPGYLHTLLNNYQPVCSVCSQDNHLLAKSSVHTCAFSYAAPQIWNATPWNIHHSPSVGSFEGNFNTFYFVAAFWFFLIFHFTLYTSNCLCLRFCQLTYMCAWQIILYCIVLLLHYREGWSCIESTGEVGAASNRKDLRENRRLRATPAQVSLLSRTLDATTRGSWTYRVAQIKWHHFTFLLSTNECMCKILWYLAQINYV